MTLAVPPATLFESTASGLFSTFRKGLAARPRKRITPTLFLHRIHPETEKVTVTHASLARYLRSQWADHIRKRAEEAQAHWWAIAMELHLRTADDLGAPLPNELPLESRWLAIVASNQNLVEVWWASLKVSSEGLIFGVEEECVIPNSKVRDSLLAELELTSEKEGEPLS